MVGEKGHQTESHRAGRAYSSGGPEPFGGRVLISLAPPGE